MGKSNWRSFEEARAFAQSLGLKSVTEWNQWYKTDTRPNDIPSDPYAAYKEIRSNAKINLQLAFKQNFQSVYRAKLFGYA